MAEDILQRRVEIATIARRALEWFRVGEDTLALSRLLRVRESEIVKLLDLARDIEKGRAHPTDIPVTEYRVEWR